MQKVKTFFHVFVNSLLPQAPYYHKLAKTPLYFSVRYFLTLVFTVNLVFSILFVGKLYNLGFFSLKDSVLQSLEQYPKELVITVRNGILQSTYGRPYFFWLDFNKQKRLLAVVDESASPNKISQYNSVVLLTAKQLVIKTDKGIKEIPYGNKEIIIKNSNVEQIKNHGGRLFITLGLFLLLFFILIAPFIFSLMYAVYFHILSMFAVFFFKIFAKKVKLSKSFQVGLHAATIPVIIDYGLCLFKPEIAQTSLIYFVFFAVSFVFIFSGIYEAYLDPVTRVHRHLH